MLVGPNASGKSAFMDVLAFLRTLVSQNLEAAVAERTENFHDLVWGRELSSFELAVEATIPEDRRVPLDGTKSETVRYEVSARIDPRKDEVVIGQESVLLRGAGGQHERAVAKRDKRAEFSNEPGDGKSSFEIPSRSSALSQVPMDSAFPATAWLRDLLREGVWTVALRPEQLRAPSPPHPKAAALGGSYLARFAAQLSDDSPQLFQDWTAHVRTELRDLETIKTVLRPEDRHRYLMLRYQNGVEVPSWVVSDGTLRLLALTVLAYMPNAAGVYLIEEPEDGLHPSAIETVHQSLSSFYDGQVLVATHSPVLVSLAELRDILCFSKTPEGTRTIAGDAHPALRDWKGEVNLSELFAAGVLD
jgi:predicted ATPase